MSTAMLSSRTARGRCHGVWQIVRFNWPHYAAALLVVVGAVLLCMTLVLPWAGLMRWTVAAGACCVGFWTAASLIVAHWIYDRSLVVDWRWLTNHVSADAGRGGNIVNVHSGFDETTPRLRALFPESSITAVDLFDPAVMTEASIHRARRCSVHDIRTVSARPNALPFPDGSVEAVCLLFAAHEIRQPKLRLRLFQEVRRILKPKGRAILVEHLRDGWNFLAFGPGCWHFLPRREWLRLARCAEFDIVEEGRITPFVGFLVLEKSP